MVLIDTSCWTQTLRRTGDPSIRGRVEQLMLRQEACWCDVVRLELWHGARDDRDVRLLRDLEEVVPILAITTAVWDMACDLGTMARQRGLNIPSTDLIIFSCGRTHEADLEHRDRHFDMLGKLVGRARIPRRY